MRSASAILDAAGRPIQRQRSVPRAFDAGMTGRRLSAVSTATVALNRLVRSYGRSVVARSRWLCRNNAYASAARDAFVSAMVGAGIVPSPLVADPELKATLRDVFTQWTDEADADWSTDFYGLQYQVAGEIFEAGECFVRFRTRLPQDGLLVPLQLQLLPSEMCPIDKNEGLGNGRRIECGIEFDPIGRRTAYHFYRVHPGSELGFGKSTWDTVAVPADEVLHIYRRTEPGQVRGVPHTVAGITTLALLELYDDAELDRKRTAALFGGFIKKPADGDDPLGESLQQSDGTSGPELQPGAMVTLDPGEEIEFAEPADVGGNYEPFQFRALTKAMSGFGVPYSHGTGDVSRANYSSERAEQVKFRRRIEAMQHAILVYQLCRPVWGRWLDEAVLAGAVPISPDGYGARRRELLRCDWIPPAWEWVDPYKDMQAEKLAVEQGFKPRGRVIRQTGYDPEEVDRERAEDMRRNDSLGLPPLPPPAGQQSAPQADPAQREENP